MASPQDGLFEDGSTQHLFLEYDAEPAAGPDALRAALREALGDPPGQAADRRPARVVAFGAALWSRLRPDAVPPGLQMFAGVTSDEGHHAPATPHGLWIWFHGRHADENLVSAVHADRALRPVARLATEQMAFTHRDSRDLTGFKDGSANPQGPARLEVALVPPGRKGAGGSHVLTQRWVHDLAAFDALSDDEQSKVIGRDKATDVELKGKAMPANSHVARTDIEKDGVAQAVYRRSVPFGGVREHGLYFLAFSQDSRRFDALLESMYGVGGDGTRDRLLDFSRPTTGAYYFAPSRDDLAGVLAEG